MGRHAAPYPYTDLSSELYLLFLHPTYYASPLVSSKLIILSGITALANAIPDMRAISQFTCSGDSDDSTPVTMETSMVEADFGGKRLGLSGAIMVAAFLPKCT